MDSLPLRCVTIDVEEYYHIESAFGRIDPQRWNDWPSRVSASVEMLLELFASQKIHATFFILGDVAKRNPHVPKLIAQQGHEIASHGTNHARLHRLGRESFRDDLIKCKYLLEDLTGQRVIGYRAPTFSIVPRTSWAIQVLVEELFEYDASIFPVVHPNYGVPTAPDRPFVVKHVNAGDSQWSGKTAKILEIPPLTWKCMGRNLAVAGGGYFRLLPSWFMQQGLAQAAQEHRPAVLYFHPWEFDPQIPRMPLSFTGKLRTYTGLRSAKSRLETILKEPARWQTMAEMLPFCREMAEKSATVSLIDEC